MFLENKTPEQKIVHIRDGMLRSYTKICLGMAIIAALFPLLVYVNGFFYGICLQPSISNYYFAPSVSRPDIDPQHGGEKVACPASAERIDPWDHPVRALFVGGLFALGVFLFLYKGFTPVENWILNFAGIFAVGVAIFPMGRSYFLLPPWFSPHGFCAIAMFVCIASIAIRTKSTKSSPFEDETSSARYRNWYNFCAVGMVTFPIIGVAMNIVFGGSSPIFWVEAVGIWIFAIFWSVKSYELNELTKKVIRAGGDEGQSFWASPSGVDKQRLDALPQSSTPQSGRPSSVPQSP